MGGCAEARRRAALAATLLWLPGCFSGHLLDAARRREQPVAIREAATDGARLLLVWDARISDDVGRDRGGAIRGGAIPLAELAAAVPRPRPLAPSGPPWATAARLPIRRNPDGLVPCAAEKPPPSSRVRDEVVVSDLSDPTAAWLAVRLAGRCVGLVPLAALARTGFAPWVWPLLPAAALVDLAVVPPLLLFAPAVIAVGE